MRLLCGLGLLVLIAGPAAAQMRAPAGDCAGADIGALNVPPHIASLLNGYEPDNAARACAPVSAPQQMPQAQGVQVGPPPVRRPRVSAPSAITGPFVRDEVLALIRSGADAQAIANDYGLAVRAARASLLLGGALVRFAIPDGRPVPTVRALLARDNRIAGVDANHIYGLQDDGAAREQPRIEPQPLSQFPRYALEHTHLTAAHQRASGAGVRIAIIDTAVDDSQPALKGAVVARFDALPGLPVKSRGHGTKIAGLAAGRAPFAGAAPGASLLIARAFDQTGPGGASQSNAAAIIAALEWAVGERAQIVNMSFAGPRNVLLGAALADVYARGVILTAAAGNNGPKGRRAYPAAEPNVLAVTATNSADRLYARANRGGYVFIACPGADVAVLGEGGAVALDSGTSFASALLSGIAALMLEVAPDLAPQTLMHLLAEAAHDLGPSGRDPLFGAGLADAEKALVLLSRRGPGQVAGEPRR